MSLFSLAKSSSENEVYIYYGKIEKTWRSKGSCLSQNHTFDNNNKMVVGRGIFELRCCYSLQTLWWILLYSNICKGLSWSLINSLPCYLILVIRQHTRPNITETRWHNGIKSIHVFLIRWKFHSKLENPAWFRCQEL